ncbi:hypothetical protein D1BOALGB6SA_9716 [Olavius sp. associated proteobacterium Delta 1]|nr:hypothetical protein D1BOALGB6SA_9716 [Olavius sp. associated proteobacterium Delta 1]
MRSRLRMSLFLSRLYGGELLFPSLSSFLLFLSRLYGGEP